MSHKRDKKRHKMNQKHARKVSKLRYLELTRNNAINQDNFDREVQNTELRQQILKCCRRLARRGKQMPLFPLVRDQV